MRRLEEEPMRVIDYCAAQHNILVTRISKEEPALCKFLNAMSNIMSIGH
jgi:hypothetical protein